MHGIRGGAFSTWRELSAAQSPQTKSAETATAASAAGMTSPPTAQLPGSDSRAQDSGGSNGAIHNSSSGSGGDRHDARAQLEEVNASAAQHARFYPPHQVISRRHGALKCNATGNGIHRSIMSCRLDSKLEHEPVV